MSVPRSAAVLALCCRTASCRISNLLEIQDIPFYLPDDIIVQPYLLLLLLRGQFLTLYDVAGRLTKVPCPHRQSPRAHNVACMVDQSGYRRSAVCVGLNLLGQLFRDSQPSLLSSWWWYRYVYVERIPAGIPRSETARSVAYRVPEWWRHHRSASPPAAVYYTDLVYQTPFSPIIPAAEGALCLMTICVYPQQQYLLRGQFR